MIIDEDDAQIANRQLLEHRRQSFHNEDMGLPAWKGEIHNNYFFSIEFFLGVLPPWKRMEIDCGDAIEAIVVMFN